jgi:uncharacterized membrane protein
MGHKALAAAGPGWPYETWKPGAPCQGRLLENRVVLSKGNVLSVYSPMTGGSSRSSYIFIKNLPPTLSPFAYMTLTSGLAGIIFIIVFFNKLRELKGKLLMHSGIMAAVICGSLFFERLGIANIPASTASFVASLNIVFVPLLLLLLKRKPTKNNLLGIVLILLGLILTSEVHPGHSLDSRRFIYGSQLHFYVGLYYYYR